MLHLLPKYESFYNEFIWSKIDPVTHNKVKEGIEIYIIRNIFRDGAHIWDFDIENKDPRRILSPFRSRHIYKAKLIQCINDGFNGDNIEKYVESFIGGKKCLNWGGYNAGLHSSKFDISVEFVNRDFTSIALKKLTVCADEIFFSKKDAEDWLNTLEWNQHHRESWGIPHHIYDNNGEFIYLGL